MKYEKAMAEVVEFDNSDVITESDCANPSLVENCKVPSATDLACPAISENNGVTRSW